MCDDRKNEGTHPAVRLIRRLNLEERRRSDGDEECHSTTEEREALDIVEADGDLYAVRTKTYYEHSYERYESPMNTYTERVTLELCPIDETHLEDDKATLGAYMDEHREGTVWGGCDSVADPDEAFVTAQVSRALRRHADDLRIETEKQAGGCHPNAVYIAYDGKPKAIYIDDFSTNEGLARALNCDAVRIGSMEGHPEIGYFYNAKVIYGLPYNRVASAVLGHCLEGPVVTCARAEDGTCRPFPEDQVESIVMTIAFKRAMMMR